MSGYVRAHRQRFDHPLFRREKFCRGYAWDWMVAHACWKAQQIDVGGKLVTLQRGQLCYSIRFLADAWNWDKAAVSRFLARLKTEAMIETQTETGQTIISVCNYDKYQADSASPETAPGTDGETAARQQRDKEEEGKKGKEYNPLTPKGGDAADFEAFWTAYPHRGGQKKNRRGAEAKFKAAIKRGVTAEAIMAGVEAMAQFPDVKRGFARDPATWLNQEGWADEAPAAGLSVIPGGKSAWTNGDLRINRDHVQEFYFGHWERRNDLTPTEVEAHPRLVARLG